MVITAPAVTRAGRLLLQKGGAKKRNISEEKEREIGNKFDEATKVRDKYLRGDKLLAISWKKIIIYILLKSGGT